MDWLLALALITFVLVAAFFIWTKLSAERHHPHGEKAGPAGIGGESDPMAGSTPGLRSAEAMRRSLNAAAASNPIFFGGKSPRRRFEASQSKTV